MRRSSILLELLGHDISVKGESAQTVTKLILTETLIGVYRPSPNKCILVVNGDIKGREQRICTFNCPVGQMQHRIAREIELAN